VLCRGVTPSHNNLVKCDKFIAAILGLGRGAEVLDSTTQSSIPYWNLCGSPSEGAFSGVATSVATWSALSIGSWAWPVMRPFPTSLMDVPLESKRFPVPVREEWSFNDYIRFDSINSHLDEAICLQRLWEYTKRFTYLRLRYVHPAAEQKKLAAAKQESFRINGLMEAASEQAESTKIGTLAQAN
jgi:hypothetical protein